MAAGAPDIFDAWLALLTEAIVRATDGSSTPPSAPDATALFILRYVEGLGVQILMNRISRADALDQLRRLVADQISTPATSPRSGVSEDR